MKFIIIFFCLMSFSSLSREPGEIKIKEYFEVGQYYNEFVSKAESYGLKCEDYIDENQTDARTCDFNCLSPLDVKIIPQLMCLGSSDADGNALLGNKKGMHLYLNEDKSRIIGFFVDCEFTGTCPTPPVYMRDHLRENPEWNLKTHKISKDGSYQYPYEFIDDNCSFYGSAYGLYGTNDSKMCIYKNGVFVQTTIYIK